MELVAPILATALIGLMTWLIRQMVVTVKKESEANVLRLKMEIEKMCDERTKRVEERMGRTELETGKITERLTSDEEGYLTQDKHQLLCSNAQLELKAHVSAELKIVGDSIFNAIRRLEEAVRNVNTP